MKPLYADPSKRRILDEMCTDYLNRLKSDGVFEAEAKQKEPVTAHLWLLYYQSQHYDFLGDHQRALDIVEEAIEHTPTLIELYTLKAKVYKHLGNIDKAVACLDEAQSLDTADRYINCKCAKYMLRADRVKDAELMCGKFTREGVAAVDSLNEMQCMWFQTECAASYRRQGKWGEALKKCLEVDRHFTEIIEDQFDFHTYCMRKMTLRSYMELLRFEDVLRAQRSFAKAAHCAIQVYLRLHDKPVTDDDKLGEIDVESLDPSELKKLRNKQKKAKRKAEQEKAQQREQQARKDLHNKAQKKNDEELDAPQKDELVPEKLERPEKPLEEALKFLLPLQAHLSKEVSTHVFAFEIYFRKRKPLLMLQSANRAAQAAKGDVFDPRVHQCFVKLQRFIEQETFNDVVSKVIKRPENSKFLGAFESSAKRNADFLEKNARSLKHLFAGAKMTLHVTTDGSKAQTVVDQLLDGVEKCNENVDIEVKSILYREKCHVHVHSFDYFQTCQEMLESFLNGEFGAPGKSACETLMSKSAVLFPHASKFRKSEAEKKNNGNNNAEVEDENEP